MAGKIDRVVTVALVACAGVTVLDAGATQAQTPEREPAGAHPDTPPSSPEQDDLLKLTLRLEGMWCPACAWLIDASLKNLPGVVAPATQFSTDTFQCRYHPVKTSPDRIIDEMGTYLFMIDLFNWGEPLLNKNVPSMLLGKSRVSSLP